MDLRSCLEKHFDELRKYLDALDNVRNEALKDARDIIRVSGWVVTLVNNMRMEEAKKQLVELRALVKKFIEKVKDYPELLYSGFSNNALSEYVEAEVLFRLISGFEIPSFKELGVPPVPYLQGLGDVVGELRRILLEHLRRGEREKPWMLLSMMEAIYEQLSSLDYPDAITPGLRHKTDVARRLVDETKAFLIDMESRFSLEDRLRETTNLLKQE